MELPKVAEKQIETARVLKLVPNARLMLIYFDDREGIFRCVKKPEDNHRQSRRYMSKRSRETMICIESPEQQDKRIDLMLRELVVEEGLSAFEEDRECRIYTIQEMADFVGVGFETMRRIEKSALSNFKKHMLELGVKNGK